MRGHCRQAPVKGTAKLSFIVGLTSLNTKYA